MLCDRPSVEDPAALVALRPNDENVLLAEKSNSVAGICAWDEEELLVTALWNSGLPVGEGEKGEPEAVRRAAIVDLDGVGENPRVYREVESGEEE